MKGFLAERQYEQTHHVEKIMGEWGDRGDEEASWAWASAVVQVRGVLD